MKTSPVFAGILFLSVTVSGWCAAARLSSDLVPPQKRQSTLETAEGLARRKAPTPMPADLPSPFNPVDFDKPDPSEAPVAPRPTTGPSGGGGATTGGAPAVVQPAAPATDRQTLETLAAQITPSGMIQMRSGPRLIFANKPFEIGTRFTASFNNQDYELELVAIDRTTFTLRYRGEEITRPIKPVR